MTNKAKAKTHAKALLKAASWSEAPQRSEWGDGMMCADIELSKDETMTVYAHKDAFKERKQ